MSTRAGATIAGLTLYVGLVLAFYGLHRLAFPDGTGFYPIWYSAGESVFNAAKAVGPGFVAGWLYRAGALRTGAIVGAAGAFVEVALLGALTGLPFAEIPGG